MRFWQFEELDGKQLAREKMMLMLSINGISEWIYNCDHLLYRNLTELLIPDVLRQVFIEPCKVLASDTKKDSAILKNFRMFHRLLPNRSDFLLASL